MIAQQNVLVRVPDVVGLSTSKAKLIVESAGLQIDAIVFQESYEARDTVLAQLPCRGQMVYAGERVLLTISRESYVKWLPAIYQRADLNGRNFVRELLWITQHLFGSIEDILEISHHYYDPFEAPEAVLPWLASWSAMVLEEDWPVAKKRRLIKKAVELYRIRGTKKGLKLFISLFTGHEPEVRENEWPFRGWRIGVSSEIGIDTVMLPSIRLAHAFIVEMPMSYQDISTAAVLRIHEIIQMEKPATAQYYLRFARDSGEGKLREFYAIGTGSEIHTAAEQAGFITSEAEYQEVLLARRREREEAVGRAAEHADFGVPSLRARAIRAKAPRADNAPVEGCEIRSREEGLSTSAREMAAVAVDEVSDTPHRLSRSSEGPMPTPQRDKKIHSDER